CMKASSPCVLCTVFFFAAASLLMSCNKSKPATAEARLRFESVIPKPVSATIEGKSFSIANDIRVVVSDEGKGLESVADLLARKLRAATAYDVPVGTGEGSILLSLGEDRELGSEGYQLTITEDRITI